MPHGVASEKVIEQGDLITLDFGCYYQGYVSDMTRTFAVGDPGDKLKKSIKSYLKRKKNLGRSKTWNDRN